MLRFFVATVQSWSVTMRRRTTVRSRARGGSSMRRPLISILLSLAVIGLGSLYDAAAQTAPARGGTLVVALAADPGHLNPAITTSGATHTAAELLYNGLLGQDERGRPVPELAESWQIEQGGAAYRFRLR